MIFKLCLQGRDPMTHLRDLYPHDQPPVTILEDRQNLTGNKVKEIAGKLLSCTRSSCASQLRNVTASTLGCKQWHLRTAL